MMEFNYQFFSFIDCLRLFKNSFCLTLDSEGFLNDFLSKSFIILCFTLKSVIHFELISLTGVRHIEAFYFSYACPIAPLPFIFSSVESLQHL